MSRESLIKRTEGDFTPDELRKWARRFIRHVMKETMTAVASKGDRSKSRFSHAMRRPQGEDNIRTVLHVLRANGFGIRTKYEVYKLPVKRPAERLYDYRNMFKNREDNDVHNSQGDDEPAGG